jgi:hypothetical protein
MNPALPQRVVDEMARRDYRMHHLLWREIRRYWNQYPSDVQEKIRELGWEPPRPATDENEAPILSNNSGEDFLYMQRQLIRRVNRILTEVGDPDYPQVEGWVRLPGPDDPDYPVPPPWFDPGSHPIVNRYVARMKTDIVFERHFRTWEKTFTDPTFLRSVSLGTLGALIDYYLVNPFRRRWAAPPGAMRTAVGPADAAAIDTVWDDARYDFLSDYYAMHVNPIYWRFAGWVDDRVEEWKYANGVFGTDFWTGTWVGRLPDEQPAAPQAASASQGASAAPQAAEGLSGMEELAKTIARSGRSSLSDVGDIDASGEGATQADDHGRADHGSDGQGVGERAGRRS